MNTNVQISKVILTMKNNKIKSNALSLFNGMRFAAMACDELGLKFDNFYISEIDKHANKAAAALYPDCIQLGDVTKWREWDIDWSSIDLLLGGSPCQGFSFAGKQAGTKAILNGVSVLVTDRATYLDMKTKDAEFLSQSHLFWEFVLCLDHIKLHNPGVKFMLENVKMKKDLLDMITGAIGVEPICINSALVSAQMRTRYYWHNFGSCGQPEDKNIALADILESGIVDRDKSYCIDANYFKGGNLKAYFEKSRRQLVFEAKNGKTVTIQPEDIYRPRTFYETRTEFGKSERKRLSNLAGRDTTPRCKKSKHYIPSPHQKSNCLVTVDSFLNWIIDDAYYCRKLTPRECFRLQTVPERHIDTLLNSDVSNSQLYKMCGNGWTHNVIVHILKGLVHTLKELKKPHYKLINGGWIEQ